MPDDVDRKLFAVEAEKALAHIDDGLGDLEHDDLDVDLAGDVLTLSFSDGAKFIINAHSAANQVWMAAGTTAWHFDFLPERGAWVASKNGDELMSTLARVVGEKIGTGVEL
jgi:CyaY protein